MIYAMSDIHRQYEQFLTLLEQIGIRKEDTLYILGDVVDRGPEPMKILKYMMAHSNIIPIIGNHEVMALSSLKLMLNEITEDFLNRLSAEQLENLEDWMRLNGPKRQRHWEQGKSFLPVWTVMEQNRVMTSN